MQIDTTKEPTVNAQLVFSRDGVARDCHGNRHGSLRDLSVRNDARTHCARLIASSFLARIGARCRDLRRKLGCLPQVDRSTAHENLSPSLRNGRRPARASGTQVQRHRNPHHRRRNQPDAPPSGASHVRERWNTLSATSPNSRRPSDNWSFRTRRQKPCARKARRLGKITLGRRAKRQRLSETNAGKFALPSMRGGLR